MNITKNEFVIIENALKLLPHGDEFNSLSKEHQDIIVAADTVMVSLMRKKKAANEKTAKYIAEKRKGNKNYARSK